jgi:hypothetical protein
VVNPYFRLSRRDINLMERRCRSRGTNAAARKNEKKTDVARLDENVEVESTRLRFSTRSTLKWRGFIWDRGGSKEDRVKCAIWTFGVGVRSLRLERYEAAFRDNKIDDILPSRCTAGSLILSAPD